MNKNVLEIRGQLVSPLTANPHLIDGDEFEAVVIHIRLDGDDNNTIPSPAAEFYRVKDGINLRLVAGETSGNPAGKLYDGDVVEISEFKDVGWEFEWGLVRQVIRGVNRVDIPENQYWAYSARLEKITGL